VHNGFGLHCWYSVLNRSRKTVILRTILFLDVGRDVGDSLAQNRYGKARSKANLIYVFTYEGASELAACIHTRPVLCSFVVVLQKVLSRHMASGRQLASRLTLQINLTIARAHLHGCQYDVVPETAKQLYCDPSPSHCLSWRSPLHAMHKVSDCSHI
jgi:hypothetical protein